MEETRSLEFGMNPLVTVFVPASIAPAVQALLVKTVYVTVPPASDEAPESVALSCTGVVVETEVAESIVVIEGVAFVVVTGSSRQPLEAGLLLASPA